MTKKTKRAERLTAETQTEADAIAKFWTARGFAASILCREDPNSSLPQFTVLVQQ